MWNGFRKTETKRFEGAIRHIKESLEEDTHDFWSALFCSGITFTEDVKRFYKYVSMVGLLDYAEIIRKSHPDWE